jgi:hypothetical protein
MQTIIADSAVELAPSQVLQEARCRWRFGLQVV